MYQSPSEVLPYIVYDLGAVSKPIPTKITMISNFRHQNDNFDVPDGNRIESPSLKSMNPNHILENVFRGHLSAIQLAASTVHR